MLAGDRVPMFKLRPYAGLLLTALFVLVIGGLLSGYFYMEDAVATGSRLWLFVLIVTLGSALLLVVAAFSRYSFPHLRHHRPGYKRG